MNKLHSHKCPTTPTSKPEGILVFSLVLIELINVFKREPMSMCKGIHCCASLVEFEDKIRITTKSNVFYSWVTQHKPMYYRYTHLCHM